MTTPFAVSSMDPSHTIHFDSDSGELYTCFHGVPEDSYGFADSFAEIIVSDLTPEQRAYASSVERGKYRGFAALHDLCDANMLLPYADESNVEEAQHTPSFWAEWKPASNDVVLAFWERVMALVTEELCK